MSKDDAGARFHYDPWKPDAWQAHKTASQWRGGHWRSPLFLFISNGCTISSEEHRRALFQEIERNMKAVESAAEYFHEDELDKLRNLKRVIQIAKIVVRRESGEGIDEERGRKRTDIELIY